MSGDLFDRPEDGDGPVERARAHVKRDLPKRFYKTVDVHAGAAGFRVELDGRPIRSPGGNHLTVPTRDLGEAVAEEWRRQAELIDPATMPLTRLVNSALDAVCREADRVRADIVNYAGNDLLLYRAASPDELIERQNTIWGPIVGWAEKRLAGRFLLAAGIVHVEQSPETLTAFEKALAPVDPLSLTAVHVITTLTGSALLALAVLERHLTADAAWAAAHMDEDWNMDLWGRDEEALARRETRFAEYGAAVSVLVAADMKNGAR